ncbi:TetR family transcriptional regulator [Kitasatospora sp. NBC_01287]|uniref:TetR/AcrR family transcriptional regulator n=1 Tax=Kitasatospora sp. NBC_01287 TaxID=2903573 RepID=UPI002251DC78|nr:TetR/AcrR family transcriptional regulator [Kitasatospora sp. NBC_01287]MCX4745745.1 TetR family transcriptional regulator [Kitasatospora sp. NBC_01287]
MGRTFTESARRTQIVQGAIEVLAEVGYARTSFAKIAKQAGLSSTGMISYHFAGKDDLMRAVATEVWRVSEEYMLPRIEAAEGNRGRLRAYIESTIELLSVYPKHLAALLEVVPNLQGSDPSLLGYRDSARSMMEIQQKRLEEGQALGEFGEFDTWVMVTALRGAIDAVVMRWHSEPHLDVAPLARQLADLFERATRREP